MTKNLLAIDIGIENMKLAVIQQTKDSYTVLRSKIVMMSEKAFDPEGYLQVNEVKSTLDSALAELKANKMPVALTINSSKKIVRTRDLPLTSFKELEGIIRYEAEQFLPYGIDQFYVDYKVLGKGQLTIEQPDKEKQIIDGAKVMIAALPKDIMDPYMNLLNESNLKIISVTLHTEALHSFAKHHILETGRAVVMCDIGYGSINTVLFENEEFLADISSESGLISIASQFSLKYGIDEKKSMDILFGKTDFKLQKSVSEVDELYKKIERLNQFVGKTPEDQTPDSENYDPRGLSADSTHANESTREDGSEIFASEVIKDGKGEFYADIHKEISRMMEFYRTRRFGAKVDAILICGGGARLSGLEAYLKDRLDTQAVRLISEVCPVIGLDSNDIDLMVPAIGGAIGR